MDSFFAFICVLATGAFFGAYIIAQIGIILEKRANADLELDKFALELVVGHIIQETGSDYTKLVEQIKTCTRNK